MNVQQSTVINGLDTSALGGLAGLLREHPEGGRVGFETATRWQDGARSFTRFGAFRIDGQVVHEGERVFVQLCDEPTELSGTDTTPGPMEQLMHAVAACVIATTNANAAMMGVELRRIEVRLEGELDLHGMFALAPDVRPGLSGLHARIEIEGEADERTLREIARRGFDLSPVRESVQNGVLVDPEIVIG